MLVVETKGEEPNDENVPETSGGLSGPEIREASAN
jgi:hypothetical protein